MANIAKSAWVAGGALACAAGAWGAAGDLGVAIGAARFQPRVSSEPLQVSVGGRTQEVAGSSSTVRDADGAAFELTYFPTDDVSVKFGFGVPPVLHLDGAGTLSGLGEIGTARLNAPVLLLRYHFLSVDDRLRPALGVGLTRVSFSRIRLSAATAQGLFLASPATGNALVGPTSAALDAAFAPVASASLGYRFDGRWFAELSASYAPIRSKATLTTTTAAAGQVVSQESFKMRSVTTLLAVGTTF